MMKIVYGDEDLSLWLTFITEIKFISLMIWGLLIDLINFVFLCLALLGHFDTFPDGWWVVGGGKIKDKDQLSLAEAWVEAELGNQLCKQHFALLASETQKWWNGGQKVQTKNKVSGPFIIFYVNILVITFGLLLGLGSFQNWIL